MDEKQRTLFMIGKCAIFIFRAKEYKIRFELDLRQFLSVKAEEQDSIS